MAKVKDYPLVIEADEPTYDKALKLRQSMVDAKTVSFIYEDKNKTVEIHAVGLSTKDGGLVARGWQVAGNSSRPLPLWALYRVEKIESLIVDPLDSLAPREGFVARDRQMNPVLSEVIPS